MNNDVYVNLVGFDVGCFYLEYELYAPVAHLRKSALRTHYYYYCCCCCCCYYYYFIDIKCKSVLVLLP